MSEVDDEIERLEATNEALRLRIQKQRAASPKGPAASGLRSGLIIGGVAVLGLVVVALLFFAYVVLTFRIPGG